MPRVPIVLVCEQCGARNYRTTRSESAKPGERLEKKKYCPHCATHQPHKESR